MASTKDRQRALERARYERVQAKIAQQRKAQARRKRVSIFTAIAVVLVGGGVASALVLTSSSTPAKPIAASTNTAPPASASASTNANAMKYEASGTSAKPGITMPTYDATAAAKPYTATIHTNRGDIVFTALTTKAPYTTYSFEYLAQKGFFDNTPCPRISNSGLFMLQCGDPTGSGTGGPGYTIPDENLTYFGAADSSGQVTYKAGTVAMANTGAAHSGGSQFFLVYKDSPLAPSYTPFGTITKGLDILEAIGAKGNDGSSSAGGGKPNESVTITGVTITNG